MKSTRRSKKMSPFEVLRNEALGVIDGLVRLVTVFLFIQVLIQKKSFCKNMGLLWNECIVCIINKKSFRLDNANSW